MLMEAFNASKALVNAVELELTFVSMLKFRNKLALLDPAGRWHLLLAGDVVEHLAKGFKVVKDDSKFREMA